MTATDDKMNIPTTFETRLSLVLRDDVPQDLHNRESYTTVTVYHKLTLFCPGCGNKTVLAFGDSYAVPDEDNAGSYFLCTTCHADWFMYDGLKYNPDFVAIVLEKLKEVGVL